MNWYSSPFADASGAAAIAAVNAAAAAFFLVMVVAPCGVDCETGETCETCGTNS
jgi:hypothetical protein